jgi:hypothetical protein
LEQQVLEFFFLFVFCITTLWINPAETCCNTFYVTPIKIVIVHLLYYGYRLSSPGVKQPGRGVNHPPPSSAEVKERVVLPLWAFMACSRLEFTFTFILYLLSQQDIKSKVYSSFLTNTHVPYYILYFYTSMNSDYSCSFITNIPTPHPHLSAQSSIHQPTDSLV